MCNWIWMYTGNVPGVDASNSATAVFEAALWSLAAPENSLLFDRICACTSRPTTLLYMPLKKMDKALIIWALTKYKLWGIPYQIVLTFSMHWSNMFDTIASIYLYPFAKSFNRLWIAAQLSKWTTNSSAPNLKTNVFIYHQGHTTVDLVYDKRSSEYNKSNAFWHLFVICVVEYIGRSTHASHTMIHRFIRTAERKTECVCGSVCKESVWVHI